MEYVDYGRDCDNINETHTTVKIILVKRNKQILKGGLIHLKHQEENRMR